MAKADNVVGAPTKQTPRLPAPSFSLIPLITHTTTHTAHILSMCLCGPAFLARFNKATMTFYEFSTLFFAFANRHVPRLRARALAHAHAHNARPHLTHSAFGPRPLAPGPTMQDNKRRPLFVCLVRTAAQSPFIGFK